jgi:hypothetical protein
MIHWGLRIDDRAIGRSGAFKPSIVSHQSSHRWIINFRFQIINARFIKID